MKKPRIKSPFEELTLTYADLAAYLKCSRWTIYNKVKDGTLPHISFGRKTLFIREDIDRLFKIPESTRLKKEGIEL